MHCMRTNGFQLIQRFDSLPYPTKVDEDMSLPGLPSPSALVVSLGTLCCALMVEGNAFESACC